MNTNGGLYAVVASSKDCGVLEETRQSYVVKSNASWAEYGCREGYRHHSGSMLRQCLNSSWTGEPPACIVDSVLPKAYLVMLIIGATLSVFVACIPYDFYRFRRRKKAARKHQERLSLMTRIAPGHAKMMTEVVPMAPNTAAGRRRYGFRSLIKAFRFVAEKMKTTNEEEGGEAGPSVSADQTSADGPQSSSNNGGLLSGLGAGLQKPGSPIPNQKPTSPKLEESNAARARMSAVLRLWSGGRSFGNRAKSVDITEDLHQHHSTYNPFGNQKRNSLANSSATISAAASTAATAAAAATASSALSATTTPSEENPPRSSTVVCADQSDSHVVTVAQVSTEHRTPSPIDENPMTNPVSPFLNFPRSGPGRLVRLSASIPEHTDEHEDGACVGSRFKVTDKKTLTFTDEDESSLCPGSKFKERGRDRPPFTFSHSMPGTWPDPISPSEDVAMDTPASDDHISALTESNVAAFNQENSLTLSEGKITSVSPESVLPLRVPPRLTREMSIDSDRSRRSDRPMSTSSSVGTEDTDPWNGSARAGLH